MAIEFYPLLHERVEMGRLHLCRTRHLLPAGRCVVAVPAGVSPAEVVEQNEEDVRASARGRRYEALELSDVVIWAQLRSAARPLRREGGRGESGGCEGGEGRSCVRGGGVRGEGEGGRGEVWKDGHPAVHDETETASYRNLIISS